MTKQENIKASGIVIEALPNANFIVEVLDEGYKGHRVNAHVSGKMRLNNIRIMPGDRVTLELTPFDLTKGRVTFRERGRGREESVTSDVEGIPSVEGTVPVTTDEVTPVSTEGENNPL